MNETSKYFGYVHRSNLKINRNGKYNCEWKTTARRKKRERVKNAIECQCIQSKSGYETKMKKKKNWADQTSTANKWSRKIHSLLMMLFIGYKGCVLIHHKDESLREIYKTKLIVSAEPIA